MYPVIKASHAKEKEYEDFKYKKSTFKASKRNSRAVNALRVLQQM